MKPPAFEYVAPRTLDDALAALARYGASARPLAGGQSLVQQMNMRQISPDVLVDLNRVPELDYVRRAADGTLDIGAMTRQQRLVMAPDVRSANPALAAAASAVAFPAVRSRGTLGGSVANAEPGAQLPLLLTVLDAQATIAQRHHRRTVPISALFAGAGATTLAPDELLVEISLLPLDPDAGYAVRELRRGHSGPPLISVVAIVELDDAGAIHAAHLGVSGASEIPLRLRDEEMLLTGQPAAREQFVAVAEQAARRVSAGDPVLAGVELRRRATRALVERALADATASARHGVEKEERP